jgi:cell fate regulator YaaT (PSP1 superfamily)
MNEEKKKNNRHRSRRHRGHGNKKPHPENTPLEPSNPQAESIGDFSDPLFGDPIRKQTSEEDVPLPEGYDFDDDSILFGPKSSAKNQPIDTENMTAVIGVRFKATGKVYYFAAGNLKAKRGDFAIVETARGPEFGEVWLSNRFVPNEEIVPPLRPILRIATPADIAHNQENRKKEEEAFRIGNEKILSHGLDMKLVDVQYTFDNSKLLFYFTSAGRVDFRELVKDLASVFRTRIELRQIGIRDEAKLIGGLGVCGRPLCCSSFLSNFGQVSIKMAKEQNLSLNSSKISGNCGRLMCCLRYEHKTYEEELKRTPPVDSEVKTPDGVGTVCEISPLTGFIKVKLKNADPPIPKPYHRDSVTVLSRPKRNEKDTDEDEKED